MNSILGNHYEIVLTIFSVFVQFHGIRCFPQNGAVTYVLEEPSGDRLAILQWNNRTKAAATISDCRVYGDRKVIEVLLEGVGREKVRHVRNFDYWKESCAAAHSKLTSEDSKVLHKTISDLAKASIRAQPAFILPGTKWCGAGNIARDYHDLGAEAKADKCCREHDHCPDSIEAKSEKYGLINTDIFTRSHCDCDLKFQECLVRAGTLTADFCGRLYFDLLRVKCFRLAPPTSSCIAYQTRGFARSCVRYETDEALPSVWQFFDNPFYNTPRDL